MFGLKKLFRVMSIQGILLMFKNILLERGVYIIGRNSRSAYDIIESMTGLIYPLKWELPRILVTSADPELRSRLQVLRESRAHDLLLPG